MGNVVFNQALGKVRNYTDLVASGSDSLVAVPIETTGIVSDAVMKQYGSLQDLLAGTSNEQTTMGRVTLANVQVIQGDPARCDADDPEWPGASGNPVSALVICYSPTSGSSDADLIPLVKLDMVVQPGGGPVKYQFHTDGFFTAANG